jgi:hypothetical protein
MLALARGGMTIKGVLTPAGAKQKWGRTRWLTHPIIELYIPRRAGLASDPCSLRVCRVWGTWTSDSQTMLACRDHSPDICR